MKQFEVKDHAPSLLPMDLISISFGRMNLTAIRWTKANGITVFA